MKHGQRKHDIDNDKDTLLSRGVGATKLKTLQMKQVIIEGLLPVEIQPFVVSPKAWIWKPWRPGLRPARVPVTVVGPAQFTIQIYLIWLTTVAGNKNPNHHGNHTLSKLTISLLTEVNSTRDFVTVTKNCHSLHHCSM